MNKALRTDPNYSLLLLLLLLKVNISEPLWGLTGCWLMSAWLARVPKISKMELTSGRGCLESGPQIPHGSLDTVGWFQHDLWMRLQISCFFCLPGWAWATVAEDMNADKITTFIRAPWWSTVKGKGSLSFKKTYGSGSPVESFKQWSWHVTFEKLVATKAMVMK